MNSSTFIGALFCTLVLTLSEITAEKRSASVVVIGAGPAGTAAASRLLQNGFQNITILEAENRIGGRINSVFFGEAFIDLGAQWCHGQNNNIVYDMAKDLNILQHTELVDDAYLSSRRRLDDDFVDEMLEMMKGHVMGTLLEGENLHDQNVAMYSSEKFNNSIYERFCNDSDKLADAKLFKQLLQHFHQSIDGALSWNDVSLITDYKECRGDQNLNWNGFGYQTILDILIQKFPNPSKQLPYYEHIALNKEVTKIIWKNTTTGKVEIECSDNSRYETDHVIFTPSIGVLKEEHQKLFSPMLPEEKQKAIELIGFGAVMKIPIYFKNKWWDDRNFTGFFCIWTEEDKLAAAKEFPDGPIKNGYRWVTDIFAFFLAEKNSHVLITWVTGEMVPEIELIPNEMMTNGIVYVLNKFFGHQYYEIQKPDAMIRSSWHSNPHFRGTYSYQAISTPRGKDSAEIELAKPLTIDGGLPVVLFAGEASHPYFFSTVHGAIETGYREADRIIDLYK